MKITIVKQAAGDIDGMNFQLLRAGQTYDVPARLANYLVAAGSAIFERRDEKLKKPTPLNRRKKR